MQNEHRTALEASLDNSAYNPSELLELRVPLSIPYISSQTSFERIDGEIVVEGRAYKYVQRKISKGELVLLCIPDEIREKIDKEKSDFGNDTNDTTSSAKKSNPVKKHVLITEYEQVASLAADQNITLGAHLFSPYFFTSLNPGFPGYAEKPPDNV